jgi:hypothetical protein
LAEYGSYLYQNDAIWNRQHNFSILKVKSIAAEERIDNLYWADFK